MRIDNELFPLAAAAPYVECVLKGMLTLMGDNHHSQVHCNCVACYALIVAHGMCVYVHV